MAKAKNKYFCFWPAQNLPLLSIYTAVVSILCCSACKGRINTADTKLGNVRISGGPVDANVNAENPGVKVTGERFNISADEYCSKESVRAWRIALAHSERGDMTEADWKAIQVKDEEDSMKILSALSRDYPKASYVKTMMGQVKQHFGKKDEAAEYYEQAMLENRSNPILLLKLANARRAGGKLDRAIKYYREVLTLAPEDPTLTAAQAGLGICLVQKDPENGEGRKLLEDALAKKMSDNLAAEAKEALENARLGKNPKN